MRETQDTGRTEPSRRRASKLCVCYQVAERGADKSATVATTTTTPGRRTYTQVQHTPKHVESLSPLRTSNIPSGCTPVAYLLTSDGQPKAKFPLPQRLPHSARCPNAVNGHRWNASKPAASAERRQQRTRPKTPSGSASVRHSKG